MEAKRSVADLSLWLWRVAADRLSTGRRFESVRRRAGVFSTGAHLSRDARRCRSGGIFSAVRRPAAECHAALARLRPRAYGCAGADVVRCSRVFGDQARGTGSVGVTLYVGVSNYDRIDFGQFKRVGRYQKWKRRRGQCRHTCEVADMYGRTSSRGLEVPEQVNGAPGAPNDNPDIHLQRLLA